VDRNYPFKSKIKYFPDNVHLKPLPPEHTLEPLHRMYRRPYFSPNLGSWEIDIVYAPHPKIKYYANLYLFCININTKYLEVYPLPNGSRKYTEIQKCIRKLMNSHYVFNMRGDGEFHGLQFTTSDGRRKSCFYRSSPFDNHNRVVDRVIRTIRDAVGQNSHDMRNPKQIRKTVFWYNHTPHLSLRIGRAIFTPTEVENNKDLEGVFIRKNVELREVIEEKQQSNGLFRYKRGNVIMIHLNLSRTPLKFMKGIRRGREEDR
jgi:hypothetical protein